MIVSDSDNLPQNAIHNSPKNQLFRWLTTNNIIHDFSSKLFTPKLNIANELVKGNKPLYQTLDYAFFVKQYRTDSKMPALKQSNFSSILFQNIMSPALSGKKESRDKQKL